MADDSLETTHPAELLEADPSVVSADNPSLRVRADLYDEEYSDEQYAEMLELYEGTLKSIVEGEIVKSKVLRVTDSHVILDVGFKSEGAVPIEQFKDPQAIEPGDEVEVFLERLEDDEGAVVLSKKKADFMRVWEKIRVAHEDDQPVMGTLQKKIKGGVVVDLMGVDAFLPGSQIALRRVPNIDELLGQAFEFKIIKLNKRRRNIVVSRRVILEAERATKREQLVKEIEVGQVRKGVVKNITDFGAFIDLGGVDGLLHITDMSYGRVSHPSEIVELGGELDVKVLDIDWDRERISLGLKQLQEYPWENVAEKYPVGVRVQGKVVSITNYGAFVELEPGIEGLVHISEMSWTRNVRHPSKIVSIGETIEAVVLKVDPSDEKISLGMKQTEQDPWLVLPLKFPLGTRITGKVRNLTSFGAFVEIEPGIDGLIHISDMSWTKRVQHPAEVVKKNDTVDVVILSIDSDNKRISLGLKQAQEDPWLKIGEDYPVGSEHEGHVVRFQDGGVVVDMGNDLEGFVPETQLPIPEGKSAESLIKAGQEASLKVMEVDPIHHRIIVAVTELGEVPPQEEIKEEPALDGEVDADAPEAVSDDTKPEGEADGATDSPVIEAAVAETPSEEATAEEVTPEAAPVIEDKPTEDAAETPAVEEAEASAEEDIKSAPAAETKAEEEPTAEDTEPEKTSDAPSE